MDPFESSPLRGWKLEGEYDTDRIRHHQRPWGSESWKAMPGPFKNGAYGIVWKEVCVSGPSKDAVCAVKCVEKDPSTLGRELNALVTFSNPHKPEYKKHFVQFLGWFDDKDHFYLTMEFLEYGDLHRHIQQNAPFPEPEAALITAQVAQALQYMHQKNFFHRDIKPLNILVAYRGPQWHVKLADFGTAKNTDGTALRTLDIGTPLYMAPELFGDGNSSDPYHYKAAVDVWSLGAVAFCLRTGSPPFKTTQQIREYGGGNRKRFPTQLLGTSTGFCMDFVLRTMDESPQYRLTIEEVLEHGWLSTQLEIHQRGEPGINTKDGQTSTPKTSTSTTTATSTYSNTWSSARYNSASTNHQSHPRPATTSNSSSGSAPMPPRYFPFPSGAQAPGESVEKGIQNLNLAPEATAYRAQHRHTDYKQDKFKKEVDSQQRADIGNKNPEIIYAPWQGNSMMKYGQQMNTVKHNETKKIQVGDKVLDLEGKLFGKYDSVHHDDDRHHLASGSDDQTVKIWNPSTGLCTKTLKGHDEEVTSVAWLHDNNRLASASRDGAIKIWDIKSDKCSLTIRSPGRFYDAVSTIAWSNRKGQLASGSGWGAGGRIDIWDPATGQRISSISNHVRHISSIFWLHTYSNSHLLASGSYYDAVIEIWDPATGQHVSTLKGHSDRVRSLAQSDTSTDGLLASGSYDDTIKIWDPAKKQCLSTLAGHGSRVQSLAWSHLYNWLASGSDDGTVKIWDPARKECLSTLNGHGSNRVLSVAWSRKDGRLASSSSDSTVRIWDPATEQSLWTLKGHSKSVNSVAWSP